MVRSGKVASLDIVGRDAERRLLSSVLRDALHGKGRAVLLEGPAGTGKSVLIDWAEQEASTLGYEVLRPVETSRSQDGFSRWEEAVRRWAEERGTGRASLTTKGGAEPRVEIFEEQRPDAFWEGMGKIPAGRSLLLVGRERRETLVEQHPSLGDRKGSFLTLARTEGEGHVRPTDIDGLASQISEHMARNPGSAVYLYSLEYLVTQNSFLQTLRLIEFLREEADHTGSSLVLAVSPGIYEPREVALLRAEADVVRYDEPPNRANGSHNLPSSEARLNSALSGIEEISRRGPLLLLMDDMESADPISLRLLELIVRNVALAKVVMIAALRDDGTEEPSHGVEHVRARLRTLGEENLLEVVRVGALRDDEVGRIVEGSLRTQGATVGSLSRERMIRASGGNPLAALSIARAARAGHAEGYGWALSPGASGRPEGPVVTGDKAGSPVLSRALRAVVASLDPEERHVLEWAALMGSPFHSDLSSAGT